MAVPDFVIDSELFLLFSPENSHLDCIKRYFHGEILSENDKKLIREAKNFHEFLKKMKSYNCTIVRNDNIRNDYLRIAKSCDGDIKIKFGRMIATKSYWNDKCVTFTDYDRERFKDTILEEKVHYVDAATQCKDYRVIVSTGAFTEEYSKHIDKLWDFDVNCEHICDFKRSLEKDDAKQD